MLFVVFHAHPRLFSSLSKRASDDPASLEIIQYSEAEGPRVPVVGNIAGRDIADLQAGDREGFLMRFGTFEVSNPDTLPFVLNFAFANGAVLVRDPGGRTIRLQNLEVRYRNTRNFALRKRKLNENSNLSSGNYELRFLREGGDVQVSYEMELWGAFDPRDHNRLGVGVFAEEVRFGAEIIPSN